MSDLEEMPAKEVVGKNTHKVYKFHNESKSTLIRALKPGV